MKNLMLLLLFTSLYSITGLAFEGVEKDNVKLPFHNKIDLATGGQEKLAGEMNTIYSEHDSQASNDDENWDLNDSEKGTVTQFIDYEIHEGGRDTKKLVDRRFNSVEPPVIAETSAKTSKDKAPVN